MVYLLKEWFVMKHIKIKDNNWVSPDEIETINGKKYLKKKIIQKKLKLDHQSQCQNQKKIQLIQKI